MRGQEEMSSSAPYGEVARLPDGATGSALGRRAAGTRQELGLSLGCSG